MYSEKLSPVIDLKNCTSLNHIIELTYDNFKNNIMSKNTRPLLFDRFIFISFDKWIDNKAEMFWHIISLGEDEKFNILPCNNDISSLFRTDNCINRKYRIKMSDGKIRYICLYRAIRINWFNDIINLANNNDKNIKSWEKDNNLYLRFQHEMVDYVVIFQIQKNCYRLLSMYPVFYISTKKEFTTDYIKYLKIKKR